MGTFSKVFKSKDGVYVGSFPPITTMNGAEYEQSPSLSNTWFMEFQFKKFGVSGTIDLYWDSYYKDNIVSFPSVYTVTDLSLIVMGQGATTEGNAVPLFVIPTTSQNTDLCIMGWTDNANLIRYKLSKRVLNPNNTYTYTTLSYGEAFGNGSGSDSIYAVAGSFHVGGLSFYGFGLASKQIGYPNSEADCFIFIGNDETCETLVGSTPDGDLFSPEFGTPATPQGGYNETGGFPHGTFDFSSDEIPVDALPTVGITTAGFVNVYKIEQNELQSLGEKLFPHFLPAEILGNPSQMNVSEMIAILIKMCYGTLISPVGTAVEINDNLGIFDILMNGKLIDYVLDCHVIPTSITGGTVSPLKIGYRTFNDLQLAKCTQDYVEVNCGSLSIDECFGNFLDYSCVVEIYLPFVGFVKITNEYWNNATINVKYQFNIIDGSFQCKLTSSRRDNKMNLHNTVIGQYGGLCCIHFPITGMQYSNVVSGLINGSMGVLGNASMGDFAGVGTNLSKMLTLRPDAPMSNGYNASSSFLAQRTPYLLIKYPAPQFSEIYMSEKGLPLNVPYPLSSVHGFTVIDNPVLNIQCNDDEYNEIVTLMKQGIIL